MARTTTLRIQARSTEEMLDQILNAIDAYREEAAAYPLSMQLARLAGIVRIHFSLGERVLYPFMLASGQRETAEIARSFHAEICHLGRRFDRFMERWSTSNAIAGDMEQFRCEAEVMFSAIRERLRRETRDLFPLADALADRPGARDYPVAATGRDAAA